MSSKIQNGKTYYTSKILNRNKTQLNTYHIVVNKQLKKFNFDKLFSINTANNEYYSYYLQKLSECIVTSNDIHNTIENIMKDYEEKYKVENANSIVISITDLNAISNNGQYILLDELNKKIFIINSSNNIYNLIVKYFYPEFYNENIPSIAINQLINNAIKKFTPVTHVNKTSENNNIFNIATQSPYDDIQYSITKKIIQYTYIDIPGLLQELNSKLNEIRNHE